ncbi:hypothetical protein F3N42_07290 [Marinihelvus fidelis]|uniref:Uncharacterized protein n=1 Tax=Marinihelvus fidelis TaxID=2613842 RepID=A0A5N0TAK7_9GAMM|nr:hypothetical protein F3N42_07290 [Marinihelvus fidelis]
MNIEPTGKWDGWSFEDGRLISPAGDAFTPSCIMACFFVRQMKRFGLARTCASTLPANSSRYSPNNDVDCSPPSPPRAGVARSRWRRSDLV